MQRHSFPTGIEEMDWQRSRKTTSHQFFPNLLKNIFHLDHKAHPATDDEWQIKTHAVLFFGKDLLREISREIPESEFKTYLPYFQNVFNAIDMNNIFFRT